MTKSLLLKGLAGVAALGGTVGGGFVAVNSGLLGGGENKAAEIKKGENKFTQKELIDKVGLSCGLTDEEKEITGDTSKECSIKENGTISIKVEDQTEEGVTFSSTSGSAKLKVGRSEEGVESYNRGLKFVVDSGDITLSKKEGGGNPTTIQKLEQFETYEIKEEGDKFYLFRKTKADVGIKNALGLGSFSLPTAGGEVVDRSFNDAEQIKKIRFEGHSEGITVNGEIGLKVSKTVDTTTFPYGYRFTFTFPSEVTINTKSLKAKIPYEFKIKKHDNSNNLTLEQAWTDDNTFTKKAGLDCSNSNKECSVSSDTQKLNVKVGNQKSEGISSINTGTGKIKMETEQEGYNQGLKFSITGGDVTISDGSGDAISKLEELETYEITEEGGKYYLTKKTSPDDLIKKTLGIEGVCELPTTNTPVDCNLDETKFKAIKFEGKDTDKPSGTATLTISKGNSTDFPFGYKFTFKTEADAEIKTDTKIKAKIPTDFKIKKDTSSGTGSSVTLTLEKAWSDFSLAEKVGLKCTGTTGSECCNMDSGGGSPSVKLNVKKGNDKKEDITGIGAANSGSGKIKVTKDQEGYNQGLKFTISEGDVSLTEGTSKSVTDFSTLEELETYEITEEGGKYYLTRKDEASKTIESQLGLPDKCKLSSSTVTCSSLSAQDLQKINFSDKESEKPTISTGSATLTITKADKTDFPLGYKFTLKSTTGDITIKASDNVVKKNISTDFKIKKDTKTPTTLTLEKAWTPTTLGAKVGLKCCDDTSGDCTIEGTEGKKLRVKQETESYEELKETNLTKKANSSGNGKIKVTKDVEGYNQGFKFEISEGNIELEGSTSTSEKITKLDEYETYEIKEDGGEWYLERKDKADKFILNKLGLDNIKGCTSLKLPTSNVGETCDFSSLDDLKKVKFENATGHSWSGDVKDEDKKRVQLEIKQDSSLTLGFKFTFSGSSTNACLPTGTAGGKVKLDSTTTGGVDYKIKKTGTGTSATLTLERHNGRGGSSSGCN